MIGHCFDVVVMVADLEVVDKVAAKSIPVADIPSIGSGLRSGRIVETMGAVQIFLLVR